LYVIRTEKRDELKDFLQLEGVQTLIHYPIPPHKQWAYKEYNEFSFPITENIHDTVLSLPISPMHSDQDILFVCDAIKRFYQT
jgi:dTDP-4-amino-4,6-dideoxygalactose transaminase